MTYLSSAAFTEDIDSPFIPPQSRDDTSTVVASFMSLISIDASASTFLPCTDGLCRLAGIIVLLSIAFLLSLIFSSLRLVIVIVFPLIVFTCMHISSFLSFSFACYVAAYVQSSCFSAGVILLRLRLLWVTVLRNCSFGFITQFS